MPDRDFPKVPDHREATYATVETAVLRERTLFSVCNDETRFHLDGGPALIRDADDATRIAETRLVDRVECWRLEFGRDPEPALR